MPPARYRAAGDCPTEFATPIAVQPRENRYELGLTALARPGALVEVRASPLLPANRPRLGRSGLLGEQTQDSAVSGVKCFECFVGKISVADHAG